MRFIVDRIIEDIVVIELETLKTVNLPIEIFPEDIKEGDLVELRILENETECRKKSIENKFNSVFKRK